MTLLFALLCSRACLVLIRIVCRFCVRIVICVRWRVISDTYGRTMNILRGSAIVRWWCLRPPIVRRNLLIFQYGGHSGRCGRCFVILFCLCCDDDGTCPLFPLPLEVNRYPYRSQVRGDASQCITQCSPILRPLLLALEI